MKANIYPVKNKAVLHREFLISHSLFTTFFIFSQEVKHACKMKARSENWSVGIFRCIPFHRFQDKFTRFHRSLDTPITKWTLCHFIIIYYILTYECIMRNKRENKATPTPKEAHATHKRQKEKSMKSMGFKWLVLRRRIKSHTNLWKSSKFSNCKPSVIAWIANYFG